MIWYEFWFEKNMRTYIFIDLSLNFIWIVSFIDMLNVTSDCISLRKSSNCCLILKIGKYVYILLILTALLRMLEFPYNSLFQKMYKIHNHLNYHPHKDLLLDRNKMVQLVNKTLISSEIQKYNSIVLKWKYSLLSF